MDGVGRLAIGAMMVDREELKGERWGGKIGGLRTQLIRLAHDIPVLRATLVPLLRDADEST